MKISCKSARVIVCLLLGISLCLMSSSSYAAGYKKRCSVFNKCKSGLSCHPFIMKCYHKPRQFKEPCMAGYSCGPGLSCQPGKHKCYHKPRLEGEPCVAGHPCGPGLQCEAGTHKCKGPADVGERCHLTRHCKVGLRCEAGTHVCKEPGGYDSPCHITRMCGPGFYCKPGVQRCRNVDPNLETSINNSCEGKSSISKDEFSLFAWNLFLIFPSAHMGANPQRAGAIPKWIKNFGDHYDVVMFSEAWMHPGKVKNGMVDAGFCNYVYDKRQMMGSGLAAYSRYPIEEYDFMNFGGYCAKEDCLADKGVLYVAINKHGRKYHIFGTHTNAWIQHHEWRRLQYGVIRDFIDSKNIPPDEMVLIAGDLNEDKLHTPEKYAAMLSDLDAGEIYQNIEAGGTLSYDPDNNALASGEKETLDFVLSSAGHPAPAQGSECSYVKPKADYFEFNNRDLSDHYGIQCNIIRDDIKTLQTIKPKPLEAVPIDVVEETPTEETPEILEKPTGEPPEEFIEETPHKEIPDAPEEDEENLEGDEDEAVIDLETVKTMNKAEAAEAEPSESASGCSLIVD